MRSCRPVLTKTDHEQLTSYLSDQIVASIADDQSLATLQAVLREARLLADDQIQPQVVTLDSECVLSDLQTGDEEQFTLVFPDEADIAKKRLSVLAPLGASLLGQSVGSTVRVPCPFGVRTVRIERLLYQPEAFEARRQSADQLPLDKPQGLLA